MPDHAVKVPVVVPVHVECIFWPEDDGWKGACAVFNIAVRAVTFEAAKRAMEEALQEHFESGLQRHNAVA